MNRFSHNVAPLYCMCCFLFFAIQIEWCKEYLGYPSREAYDERGGGGGGGTHPLQGILNMSDTILYVLFFIMAGNQLCQLLNSKRLSHVC